MKKLIFSRFRISVCGISVAMLILWADNSYGLAVRTVTQNGDAGAGSLRQAIANAASGDIVNFSVTGTITLTSGTLTVNKNLTIAGPGSRSLNVAGGVVFTINAGSVTMVGLTIGPGTEGVFLSGGALTMNDCAISGNANGGGIFTNAGTTLNMNRCTIYNNALDVQGGAGLQNEGTATLTNCTVSGNNSLHNSVPQLPSGLGGGLSNNGGTLTLNSCTVTGNTAFSAGGGIHVLSGAFQITNTIVANNSAPSGPDGYGTFVSNGYNLIGIKDGSTGFTNSVNHDLVGTAVSPRDAFLGPLQNNGGPTDTNAIASAASPAVNAANNNTAPARDQRSFIRPDAADMGALEFNVVQPTLLANISSRAVVGTGDNVLIGGFIITGTQQKRVILRAIGPSLSLPGKLTDSILSLYNSANNLVATNDDWYTAANAQEIAESTIAPTHVLESAILASLDPGSYTFSVIGYQGATGIGVVEAYDLDRTANSKLGNISTRAAVQNGNDVLIGGFIVGGPNSLPVVVRAIGPSLSVPDHMLNPTLELHDGNGATLATNDDWRSTQEAAIIATGVPPANDAESAIVMTLAPGSYTAVVSGASGTTGVAVVEVYGLL